jgi:PLD-like domain
MALFSGGAKNRSFSINAYAGDNKTLLAFNFTNKDDAKNLAGFTISCELPGQPAFYLFNFLAFQNPSAHSQVSTEPPKSLVNAPWQKYRFVDFAHAGSQGGPLITGDYLYTATPRYFDANGSMQALDSTLSATVKVPVAPFTKGALSLGFSRGYMQSEAFARKFGQKTAIQPAKRGLEFDTSSVAGTNAGASVTYDQIYSWTGATARTQVFNVLHQVLADPTLRLDVFAYDLNEPDVVDILLKLAAQKRVRVILDSAPLHLTSGTKVAIEDLFTTAFKAVPGAASSILRACFDRYSHDKVFIISKGTQSIQALTGSTNFSVFGIYVNANHVLVFDDIDVAGYYEQVFETSWKILSTVPPPSGSIKASAKSAAAFAGTPLATGSFSSTTSGPNKMTIHVSPHTTKDVSTILGAIAARIGQEKGAAKGNVLFAVMQMTNSNSPVYAALSALNKLTTLVSYGISDSPGGLKMYVPGSATGILVTGKPSQTQLPPPFDQVPLLPGHEIHDKFVVCGLNGMDPVVYCGSSNLASGGEAENGDNLLEIHDPDVATAFAIEALLLVDHYNFLDHYATKTAAAAKTAAKKAGAKPTPASTAKKTAVKKSAKKSTAKKPAEKRTTARTASLRVSPATAALRAPKKSAKKTVKKMAKKAANKSAAPGTAAGQVVKGKLVKQPQSLSDAATASGMYLYTDDAWSQRYFNPGDLHYLDRELFG